MVKLNTSTKAPWSTVPEERNFRIGKWQKYSLPYIFNDLRKNQENSYSNSHPLFTSNFKNLLFQITIHILNYKTTQKCLVDLWIFTYFTSYICSLSLWNYVIRHVGNLTCELLGKSSKMSKSKMFLCFINLWPCINRGAHPIHFKNLQEALEHLWKGNIGTESPANR